MPDNNNIGLPLLHGLRIDRMDPPEVVVPMAEEDPPLADVQTQVPRVAVVEGLVSVSRDGDDRRDRLQVPYDLLRPDVPRVKNELHALGTEYLENVAERETMRVCDDSERGGDAIYATHRSV
jgi:hypothetical protein